MSGRGGLPLRLGVLTERVTPGLVDEVVEVTGAREVRRRMLPARAVVYFVLGLALFSVADSLCPPGYRWLLRSLTTEWRELPAVVLPGSSALTKAGQRLGVNPLRLLFERTRGCWPGRGIRGGSRSVGGWWPGTPPASRWRTRPRTPRRSPRSARAGHPQLQLLTLIECGTHAVLDAAFDGVANSTEHALARRVLASLSEGMLVLADRNFCGHELWSLAAGTGADLVWRVRAGLIFAPVTELPDGSFLSVAPTRAQCQRRGQARRAGRELTEPVTGHTVRIIDDALTVHAADGTTRTEPFRLITTLLDPEVAPAAEVAAVYSQRWEAETGYGEFKTRLRGAQVVLRWKSPDLVDQELFAFLTVSQALTALRTQAARRAGLDPDRVSFTLTLPLARDHAGRTAAQRPGTLARARTRAITDLVAEPLPARRHRHVERINKPPRNTFRTNKPGHFRPESTITYTITMRTHQPS